MRRSAMQPSLRSKQKNARWPGVDVAIWIDFLMTVDQGIFKAESNDLPFVIDGKSAGQNYVSGKVGDGFIQVNKARLAGPEKGAGSKTILHLTDDLPCII